MSVEKIRPEQPKSTYDLGCSMHRIIFPYCTNIRLPGFHKRKESQNKEASSSPPMNLSSLWAPRLHARVPILSSNEPARHIVYCYHQIYCTYLSPQIHPHFFLNSTLTMPKAPQHPTQQPPSSLTSHHCFSPSNIQRCRWKA